MMLSRASLFADWDNSFVCVLRNASSTRNRSYNRDMGMAFDCNREGCRRRAPLSELWFVPECDWSGKSEEDSRYNYHFIILILQFIIRH